MSLAGYLGPAGTFSESALAAMPSTRDAAGVPFLTVEGVLDAVRSGEVAGGVVPIENSVEGPVTTTLDSLAHGESLVIVDEWALPVRFALMARPDTRLADISRVSTIPIAAAQCRGWLRANLPDAAIVPALSTAGAAAALAGIPPGEPGPFDAAISPVNAAERYGLRVLADNIGDSEDALTRFVHVRRPQGLTQRTGADKTTLVLYMREDHAGALLEILTEFAVRGVNLTRIESRPTKRQLGDYYFSLDCEGHVLDARVGEALTGLRRVCADVRFLGSYPRHDGKEPHVRPGTSDADFREAAAWLSQVRSGGA